jgi:hypothetical protein
MMQDTESFYNLIDRTHAEAELQMRYVQKEHCYMYSRIGTVLTIKYSKNKRNRR